MIDRANIKVLALDDEPFILSLQVGTLRQLGFVHVSACGSALDALRLMDHSQGPPDLILLDLNMPEMDGVEFLRKLVERHYVGALILVSGEDEPVLQSIEKLVQAHRITALGHLRKPVHAKALEELIETWRPAVGDRRRAARAVFEPEEVRAGIAGGELINYYQPLVEIASGALWSVEALVRWRHPRLGLIYPDQFIGIAESNGFIGDLTRAVLAEAFAQVRDWRKEGIAVGVAINVSTEDLASLDFPDIVARCTAEAGLTPVDVMLEVTESRLMAKLVIALDVLNRLRLKRFRLSIDDFGTGHSSLAQLRDIPFDELKIDRGFVHGAATDAKLRAIFSASLELGKQLQMKVVAEGVEDRADWDFLLQSGCDLAQGYFVAKPMPAADLPGWLAGWQVRWPQEISTGR
jgi:EAL domain-containing protein (putative c-di-GMP-specific phosphodiesterase class I)/FixJ family two-component response regulator